MIHSQSLDSKTVALLRNLVVATYYVRDDLYLAVDCLKDKDLAAICRKLADDLAGNTAYLEQIILMQNEEPEFEDHMMSSLNTVVMMYLRKNQGDEGIISAIQQGYSYLSDKYYKSIAGTSDSETQKVLEKQKKDVDFAQRVLQKIIYASDCDQPYISTAISNSRANRNL